MKPCIPILEIDDLLIVSIQQDLDDSLAVQLQNDLSEKLAATESCGIVIDFTAVEVVDSFIARVVGDIARITQLIGSHLVVTGIKPQVAITLVDLGIYLSGVTTALNLQKGINLLRKMRSDNES